MLSMECRLFSFPSDQVKWPGWLKVAPMSSSSIEICIKIVGQCLTSSRPCRMYQLMPWGWIIFILRVDRRSSESGRLRMKWKCDRYASPLIISPRPDTDTAPNWLQWGLNGGRGKCFSIFFIFSSCPEATWRLWSVCGLSRIDQEMIVNREPVSISSNSRDILENNWKVYKVHKVVSVQRLQREESNKPLPAAVFEKRELLLIASVR